MADLKISEFVDGGRVRTTDQIATNRGGVNNYVYVGTAATLDVGTNAGDIPTNALIPTTVANTLRGTSTSTVSISVGSNDFLTEAGKSFEAGRTLTIVSTDGAVRATGIVTSYDNDTGDLEIDIQSTTSSASKSDWLIFVSGERGEKGDKGDKGDPGSGSVQSVNGVQADSSGDIEITLANLDSDYEWQSVQTSNVLTIPYASSVSLDFAGASFFRIGNLTGNITFLNPVNLKPGATGAIFIRQDSTGGRFATFGSSWKFSGDKTLTSTANANDVIIWITDESSNLFCRIIKDFK